MEITERKPNDTHSQFTGVETKLKLYLTSLGESPHSRLKDERVV
jgi:hypothetical protein